MKKFNRIVAALAAGMTLFPLAFAGGESTTPKPPPICLACNTGGVSNTITTCGSTSSFASGATTAVFGQTGVKGVLDTSIGKVTLDSNVFGQADGAGSSMAGTNMNYGATLASGPWSSFVAEAGNQSAYANGLDPTTAVGGGMKTTGELLRGTSSIKYTNESGGSASGVGYNTMNTSQQFTGTISGGYTPMPFVAPVRPNCLYGGC